MQPTSKIQSLLFDEKSNQFSASRVALFIALCLNAIVVLWYITLVTIQALNLGHFPQLLPDLSWLFGASGVGTATGGAIYSVNKFASRTSELQSDKAILGDNLEEITNSSDGEDEEPIEY